MKHLEGEEVYLIPTGNLIRRSSQKTIKALIIKVSRVFVTIKLGRSTVYKLRIRGKNELYNHSNGGYIVCGTWQDAENHFRAERLSYRFGRLTAHDYMKIDLNGLNKINEILKDIET